MRFRSLAFLIGLLLVSGSALAQTETGRIAGTVTDPQGAVIPGANVTATSVSRGVTRTTVSDANGRYVLSNLTADTYDVNFELAGFKSVTSRVVVTVGANMTADAKLAIGNVTEKVTVTAVTELIETSTPEFRTTVSTRQLVELPTLTRNPYDLVALSGNVQEAPPEETLLAGVPRGTGFSINGARTASTNILLDGGDNND